jgi:hypothetical protein
MQLGMHSPETTKQRLCTLQYVPEAELTCLEKDRAQVDLDKGFKLGIILSQPQLQKDAVQQLKLTHGWQGMHC